MVPQSSLHRYGDYRRLRLLDLFIINMLLNVDSQFILGAIIYYHTLKRSCLYLLLQESSLIGLNVGRAFEIRRELIEQNFDLIQTLRRNDGVVTCEYIYTHIHFMNGS